MCCLSLKKAGLFIPKKESVVCHSKRQVVCPPKGVGYLSPKRGVLFVPQKGVGCLSFKEAGLFVHQKEGSLFVTRGSAVAQWSRVLSGNT